MFAYMRGLGYVGCGKVTRPPAVMARDFTPDGQAQKLLNLKLNATNMSDNLNDPYCRSGSSA